MQNPQIQREYSLDELVEIARSNPSPEVRASAVRVAYATGSRDQQLKSVQRTVERMSA